MRLGEWGLILRHQPRWAVRLRAGSAQCVWGSVAPSFLKQCSELELPANFSGLILGQKREQGVRLVFSRNFSEGLQQRVRNLWGLNSG